MSLPYIYKFECTKVCYLPLFMPCRAVLVPNAIVSRFESFGRAAKVGPRDCEAFVASGGEVEESRETPRDREALFRYWENYLVHHICFMRYNNAMVKFHSMITATGYSTNSCSSSGIKAKRCWWKREPLIPVSQPFSSGIRLRIGWKT
jgi:hypothetical protein